MQTSQVTSPANALTGKPATGKQADANSSSEPFGQVLSREIAERRSVNEPAKGGDAGKASVKNAPRQAEQKPAADTKSKQNADGAAEAGEIAPQVSEEILALVANLTQAVTPAAADAPTVDAGADLLAGAVPAMIVAANSGDKRARVATTQLADSAQLPDSDRQRKPAALAGLATERTGPDAKAERASAAKADLPGAAADNVAAKGLDLVNGASTKSGGPDFAAALKDSASGITGAIQGSPQATLHAAAQSALGNAAERLTPRVGTPAWDQALGQKVVWMVAGEHQSASLTLNPPDLGPLQVVLNVSNSQATATFTAAQPEVRQALEAAMPKLREMLEEAGIQLGQASVNSESPSQQSAPDRQASAASRERDAGNGSGEPGTRVSQVKPAATGRGLVDTFA